MAVTDPIADLLTRIRNAVKAQKRRVDIPFSNQKKNIIEILKAQNFIVDYQIVEDDRQNILRVFLRYTNGVSALSGLQRISKPGLRIYSQKENLPRVLNGYGISIISTSKGLLTDKQAKREAIGGEVICKIW
ncbi:MAG: 30S ribosomal protein S8 [Ignavibacteria bacterium CG_4_8_14_3_um_filter_37_9]|nr:MAG: 30S ribosomal protein S8 [Ignavibacteria bacterium CG1_02_37_35]PIS44743.1 MAG: 30S ribosomal protein S8 [Ignavibacteria bacterium CG08_land_8_20_14_0_20_37_9]PIW98310.1 MAG: 30S ribosomal protein S8 [Ignavibacteria bacterium CG_4_8_14_3_um_filter_37_9]PIX95459.1 MAG: 30S ribosomal protein S8 [Ignavibacteria bacterium CG_4_10_14_3_um_filter_37_18]PJC59392.1 MAG: 30S ribosomal protein S8 [Ignavibacteria bacterium CG_4_9_14_0_2_um_filter_37_13]